MDGCIHASNLIILTWISNSNGWMDVSMHTIHKEREANPLLKFCYQALRNIIVLNKALKNFKNYFTKFLYMYLLY